MSSVLKCPSCHQPISTHVQALGDRKAVVLFCGTTMCQPEMLSDGIPGRTVEESYHGLMESYRSWLARKAE